MSLQARDETPCGVWHKPINKMHKPFDSKMIEHRLAMKLLAQYPPRRPRWHKWVLLLTITATLTLLYFNA